MTQDVLDQARAKMREKGIVLSGDAASQGIGAMTDARWADFFQIAVRPAHLSQGHGLSQRLHAPVPADGREVASPP